MANKVAKSREENVLTIAQPTQNDIPALLETVNKKISQLKGNSIEKESTASVDLTGFGQIKNISKVEDLIKAHSMLTAKSNAYNSSAKALDVDPKKYPFIQNGCSLNQWENDIKLRLAVVKNKTELEKLEKVKKLLEENLSQESKLANDLKKAQSILLDE